MPVGGPAFSSVRKARAALKERAHEILDGYLSVIKQAAAAGDYETAVKGYQHLMDHMPADEGERIIDISVDKVVQDKGPSGPGIQIGVMIGGLGSAVAALPEALPTTQVIDVTAKIIPEPDTPTDG